MLSHWCELAEELQLLVAAELDLRDATALCLASPPPFGLRALRTIPRFQDKLMSVALRLAANPSGAHLFIDEQLLRGGVSHRRLRFSGDISVCRRHVDRRVPSGHRRGRRLPSWKEHPRVAVGGPGEHRRHTDCKPNPTGRPAGRGS